MGNAMQFLEQIKDRENKVPEVKFDEDKAIREFRAKKSSKITKISKCECCERNFTIDYTSAYGSTNQQNCLACRGYSNSRKRRLVKMVGGIRRYEDYIKKEVPYNQLKSKSRKIQLEQVELRKEFGVPFDTIVKWMKDEDRRGAAR